MAKKVKRQKSIIVRVIVLCVAGYMLFTLIGLFRELGESQKRLAELRSELKSEELKIEELKSLLDEGSHADIIEKAARERLGYVYSNEEVYVDISGN